MFTFYRLFTPLIIYAISWNFPMEKYLMHLLNSIMQTMHIQIPQKLNSLYNSKNSFSTLWFKKHKHSPSPKKKKNYWNQRLRFGIIPQSRR